ncbi:MAG: aminotransferase class III-fold pyridoxal phosphate-dependent enzyme, partial [Candidatus Hydrogenedentes bacterium]|nr:aminotransferase class III-fold pyridoxal phosphate-dependent enzyme [Candidatus Hydrogenedentota bacterium]
MDDSLQVRDYRHLWHPYTDQAAYEQAPYVCIEWAEGPFLYDTSGRAILDGISSWWCVALGHGHPHVVEAIREQAGCLQQSILGGLSHVRAVELAERLAAIAPGDLNRCYFAADGSSVVEAALKIAVQYWRLRGQPQKARFVSLEGAYHGDTLGAMCVGPIAWFREPYGALLQPALQAPSPSCTCCDPATWSDLHCAKKALDALERLLTEHA